LTGISLAGASGAVHIQFWMVLDEFANVTAIDVKHPGHVVTIPVRATKRLVEHCIANDALSF
jgi:hypothetical protein